MKGSFSKIVRFKDKFGKLHAYIAKFIDGFMVEEDYNEIQKIINCQN
jgi:hypothetical protein